MPGFWVVSWLICYSLIHTSAWMSVSHIHWLKRVLFSYFSSHCECTGHGREGKGLSYYLLHFHPAILLNVMQATPGGNAAWVTWMAYIAKIIWESPLLFYAPYTTCVCIDFIYLHIYQSFCTSSSIKTRVYVNSVSFCRTLPFRLVLKLKGQSKI